MSQENILFRSEDNKFHKFVPLTDFAFPPRVGDTIKITEENVRTTYQVIRVILNIPSLPYIDIVVRKI